MKVGAQWEKWRAKRHAKIKRMEQRSRVWRSGENGNTPAKIARTVSLVLPPVHVAPPPAILTNAPVTLTALICGDPLPGRSALDQRGGRA